MVAASLSSAALLLSAHAASAAAAPSPLPVRSGGGAADTARMGRGDVGLCTVPRMVAGKAAAPPCYCMQMTVTGYISASKPARFKGGTGQTELVWGGNESEYERPHNLTVNGALVTPSLINTQLLGQVGDAVMLTAYVDSTDLPINCGSDPTGGDPDHHAPKGTFTLAFKPQTNPAQQVWGKFVLSYDWDTNSGSIEPMSVVNSSFQLDVFGGFNLTAGPEEDPPWGTKMLEYIIASCPPPSTVSHGVVATIDVGNTGYNNTAQYECDDGFELSGPKLLTCNQSGMWSDLRPKCVCACTVDSRPAVPNPKPGSHGNVTHRPPHGNATISGNTAAFKCFEGYKIRAGDVANLTCQGEAGEAKWSGPAPQCHLACAQNFFDNFTTKNHGLAKFNKTDPAQVNISCQQGYSLKYQRRQVRYHCNSTTGNYEPAAEEYGGLRSVDSSFVAHYEAPVCSFACDKTPPDHAYTHANGAAIQYKCYDGYTAHDPFLSSLLRFEWPHLYLFENGFHDTRTCRLNSGGRPELFGGKAPPVCTDNWWLFLISASFLCVLSLAIVAGRRGLRKMRQSATVEGDEASPGVTVDSTQNMDNSFMKAMKAGQEKYNHVLDSDEIDFKQVKVFEKVGIGSSAAVFKARMHGTEVAVKRLNLMLRNDEERLFKAEVKMLLQLRHPNVVQFYGVSFATDDCYLVTEYCERGSLYDFLQDKSNKLPYQLQLRMAKDAACGLDFLHQKNTIHRDMKSGNLLVADDFKIKICDFGISRHANTANTMTASLGTVPWTAPEMLRGERYSKKVDCYSLGVCIWELTTRRIPYEGVQSVRIITSVINGMRPQIPKTTPAVLTKLISLCWHTKASMRPTAGEIVKTLESALQDELGGGGGGGGGGAIEVGVEGSLQGGSRVSREVRPVRPAPSSDPGAASPLEQRRHSD
jgi:tRNA A-37 threonylcarbamoyl transferase component Bud32